MDQMLTQENCAVAGGTVALAVECPGCMGTRFHPLPRREFLSFCEDCELVFDNPRPTPESISAFYNQEGQYDGWLQDLDARDKLWRRRLRKMRPHARPGGLLDVGAGIGQFLNHAKAEYSPLVGVEISSGAIDIAKQFYNLEIIYGDIDSIEPNQQFDNVTAFHVLEHVHRPSAFLNSCKQFLKAQGRLFLAVPNELEALAFRIGIHSLSAIKMSEAEIHLSHFTTRSLSKLLRRCGFEIVELSLDPFWVGSSELFQSTRYVGMGVLHRLTGINLYPTIWVAAQKP